jgi:hypothetical protein
MGKTYGGRDWMACVLTEERGTGTNFPTLKICGGFLAVCLEGLPVPQKSQ